MLWQYQDPLAPIRDLRWISRPYGSTPTTSPFAFVANQALFELEEKEGVKLEWLPYTLRIPEFMGTVEERTPHFWRKVRYSYMDARRYANAQGLTIKGPQRKFMMPSMQAPGMLFAQRHGIFRAYHDTVFRRFWNHELELDELPEISGVIAALGGSVPAFEAYVNGPARDEHDRIITEAEAIGVFGVPTMVSNGELSWGNLTASPFAPKRIRAPETVADRARQQATALARGIPPPRLRRLTYPQ